VRFGDVEFNERAFPKVQNITRTYISHTMRYALPSVEQQQEALQRNPPTHLRQGGDNDDSNARDAEADEGTTQPADDEKRGGRGSILVRNERTRSGSEAQGAPATEGVPKGEALGPLHTLTAAPATRAGAHRQKVPQANDRARPRLAWRSKHAPPPHGPTR
jgi:hypothetical protein